jgi:hypothetical protein
MLAWHRRKIYQCDFKTNKFNENITS